MRADESAAILAARSDASIATYFSSFSFSSAVQTSMLSTVQPGPISEANFLSAAGSRPPLYSSPSSSPAANTLSVGYPRTPNLSQSGLPPAVQSASAMRTLSEPSKSAASLSQSGFIFLQWPHHGAKNLRFQHGK